MQLGALVVLYVLVVLVLGFIFCLPCFELGWSCELSFFVASLIGAALVFILSANVDWNALTDEEKAWYSLLWLVAYLLPLVLAIFIIVRTHLHHGEIKSKSEVICDRATGECLVQKSDIKMGHQKVKVLYQ